MSTQPGQQPFRTTDTGDTDTAVVTIPVGAEARPEEGTRKATVR